jgi:hypothetical protein
MRSRYLFLPVTLALWSTMIVSPVTAVADGDVRTGGSSAAHGPRLAKINKPWVTVAEVNLGIDQPDVLRVGNRIHVIWSRYDDDVRSVRTRLLTSKGAIASPTRAVVTNWLAVIGDPKLVKVGSDLIAVFAGIRSSAAGDPYVGPAVHASSIDGLDWTLEPGTLSQTTAAGNAQSIDVVNAAGEPLFAMGGFGEHMIMHRGVSDESPASEPDFFTSDTGCCPTTSVALANDTKRDQVWGAWFAPGATEADETGVFAQKVWPRPNGTLYQAPGTARGGGAANPGLPVALASASKNGVWAAYSVGYPTSKLIRVWKVGTNRYVDVKTGQHVTVALAGGPGGRLWLSWRDLATNTFRATRSNAQVTKFGAVRTIKLPGGSGGQLNTVALEGKAGPLTAVVGSQPPGSGSNGIYAAQILPGLTVKVSPKKLSQGKVTVRVTDAGSPVRGATVAFRGKSLKTNAHGKVVFRIGASVPDRRYPAVATKRGYAKAVARVRVT